MFGMYAVAGTAGCVSIEVSDAITRVAHKKEFFSEQDLKEKRLVVL